MFRTSIKIIGTVLAAAIVVVPVASAGGPRTPAEGNSPALRDYRQGLGFSFKAPSYWNAAPSYWSTARGAAPITVRGGMNRSLGVPPQYLGTHHAAVATAKVDPLAVGYLIGQGLSPSEVTAWTTGSCSQEIKTASCYAMLRVPTEPEVFSLGTALAEYAQQHGAVRTEPKVFSLGTALAEYAQRLKRTATPKVDPFAVSYLIGQGLTASQVTSWTVGACSHQTKAPSCYAMFKPAATVSTQVARSTGFQWGDASIGAGFTLGIVLLLGGAGAGLFISRQNRHPGGARVNQVRVEV